jgi:queuosine precursor transporter
MKFNLKAGLLLALYICTLLTVNITGTKTTTINNITFSVGLIIFPVLAIIQDAVSEVFGTMVSKQFLYIGLFCSVLVSIYLFVATSLPPSSRFADQNESYNTIFGQSIRIIISSLVAFLVSDFVDITIFQKLKTKMNGKMLWVRVHLSTTVSVVLDTLLFMFSAFLYTSPKYTPDFVIQIAIPYMLIKLVWLNINSPFVIPVVRWLEKGQE